MPYRTHLQRRAVPIPAGYEVSDEPGCLTISWRVRDQPPSRSSSWLAGVGGLLIAHLLIDQRFILFYVLLMVIVGLVALVQTDDRVQVAVRGFSLVVSKSPLAPQARTFAAGEIDQLYCVLQHGEKRHTYELWVELRGAGRLCLLRGLDTAEAALFLESVLERRLGIPDRPVEGEIARS